MRLCPQTNVVPYLIDNPRVGFVQARWAFTNPEESYLTKASPPALLVNLPKALVHPTSPLRTAACETLQLVFII
jgi:hypothetical protein